MKIQIDTDNKVIKVEKSVNLGKFFDYLDKIFPNDEWKEFTLETNVEVHFTNPQPVYVEPFRYRNPQWPPQYPWITCDSTNQLQLNSGIYDVEVKSQ